MAASKPQSTLSRNWAASLEQMNKGETGQSNGEKQRARRKSSRLLTPQLRAAACVRSVLEDQDKLLIECENGRAYKCPDRSVSLVIKLDKIEPTSFEGDYDHTNDCIRISSDLPRR
jgi:hypothetical protein